MKSRRWPVVVGLALMVLMTVRKRQSLELRGARWAVLGYLSGAVTGAAAVVVLAEGPLAMICGAAILLGVLVSVSGRAIDRTTRALVGAGVASGFMGTASGVSGPPMALLYQHAEGPRLRSTVSGVLHRQQHAVRDIAGRAVADQPLPSEDVADPAAVDPGRFRCGRPGTPSGRPPIPPARRPHACRAAVTLLVKSAAA